MYYDMSKKTKAMKNSRNKIKPQMQYISTKLKPMCSAGCKFKQQKHSSQGQAWLTDLNILTFNYPKCSSCLVQFIYSRYT